METNSLNAGCEIEIFDSNIFYYKNVISNSEELIHLLEKSNESTNSEDMISSWRPWVSTSNGNQFGYIKDVDYEKYNTSSNKIKYIYKSIDNVINYVSKDYSEKLGIELGERAPLCISKYSESKFMGPHTDEQSGAQISAVLYLNDDYSGGELNFPNQNVSIKPISGSIIIFPSVSPYVHDPQPSYKSEKYICPVFWCK